MTRTPGPRELLIRPCVRLTMPSIPRYLAVIRAAVGCMAGQEGFAAEVIDQLVLATDEGLANVIKHGYQGQSNGEILVILRPVVPAGRPGLEIVILDRGRSIDPAAICGRDLDDLRPGGLGVHIIRSVMDKVQYRQRRGGGMLLRMVKYAAAGPSPGKDSPSAVPAGEPTDRTQV